MIIQKYIFLFLSKNLSYDPLLRTILAEVSRHHILYGKIGKLYLLPLLIRSTDTLTFIFPCLYGSTGSCCHHPEDSVGVGVGQCHT